MKGNTSSRTVSNIFSGAVSLKRDQRRLSWSVVKIGSSMGLPVRAALRLLQRVQLVEPLDEEQVGELLDDRERVRDTAGPHRVPDAVDLGFEFTGDHESAFPYRVVTYGQVGGLGPGVGLILAKDLAHYWHTKQKSERDPEVSLAFQLVPFLGFTLVGTAGFEPATP